MTSYCVQIMQCHLCTREFAHLAVGSSNTFGAVFFTDGSIQAPMYDEGDRLAKCPHCRKWLWLDEALPTRLMDADEYFDNVGGIMHEFPLASSALFGDSIVEALHSQPWRTRADEKYLRLRAWWYFNHLEPGECKRSAEDVRNNRAALLRLLDETDEYERILKAEALRHSGSFAEATAILHQRPISAQHSQWAEAIETLAKRGDMEVREFPAKPRDQQQST